MIKFLDLIVELIIHRRRLAKTRPLRSRQLTTDNSREVISIVMALGIGFSGITLTRDR